MARTLGALTVREVPKPYDPTRTGVLLELERGGEVRRLYLPMGQAPINQGRLDGMDAATVEGWWGRGR